MRANMQAETVEVTLSAAASKVTYFGSGSAVIGWLFSTEFAAISGIVIALAGLAVNWYYKRESNRREQEVHELRVTRIRANMETTVPAPLGDV